jgi:hypothetical protein
MCPAEWPSQSRWFDTDQARLPVNKQAKMKSRRSQDFVIPTCKEVTGRRIRGEGEGARQPMQIQGDIDGKKKERQRTSDERVNCR